MDDEKILTSENSPELKALIEKISEEVLEENREAYEDLAKFDSIFDEESMSGQSAASKSKIN